MNQFLDLLQIDDAVLARLLASATALERDPISQTLRGRVLGLVFLNPSLRTMSSCQAGMAQLGGSTFVIAPGQGSWQLEHRDGVVMDGAAAEHLREAIPVLEQYSDAIGLRSFAGGEDLDLDRSEPVLATVAGLARKPLVSLESAMNHPCQAFADLKTIEDLQVPARGGRFVLSWAWHPRALPLAVPLAAMGMAARRGMDVTVLAPEGFGLPEELLAPARAAATRAGGSLRQTRDQRDAMEGAHVLYAKSWRSPQAYGAAEAEAALRAQASSWCVRESWFDGADPDAVFMHCLPVRRNVVVADEVLDGGRSRVVQQAGNRLHVQKAVFLEMMS